MPGTSTGWERVAATTGGTVGGLAWATVDGQPCVFAATSVGVYRSLDAGRTWAPAGLRNSVPFAEAVVPSARYEHDRTIFACAGDGLYRSSDGGGTWQPVLVGGRMLSAASASVHGGEGLVLLVGTDADGVLRSEDGGRSWAGANAGLLDLTALALVVSPQFASDRLGFAGTASGLYRTRNGARSWRELETGLTEPAVQCVAVSPTFAEDRLVLAGTEADGLLWSDDAGTTWNRPASLAEQGVTAVAFSCRYRARPKIAAAIESGIALSDDGGRTWRRSAGSPPGSVLSLMFVSDEVDGNGGEVLLAGLHRQGVARSVDDGASWALSATGLSARLLTGLALSPAFADDGTVLAFGPQDGVSVSVDAGRTWTEQNRGLEDTAVLGVAVSPEFADDRTLYAASAAGIHVSHDAGVTWAPTAAAAGPARTIACPPGVVHAGTGVVAALAGGALVASDDGGTSWRALARIAEGVDILLVAPSPTYARDRTLFVATSQAAAGSAVDLILWRSADAGQRWDAWLTGIGAGSGQPFMAVALSPTYTTDEMVFAATGANVLRPLQNTWEVQAGKRRPVWRAAELGAVAVTAVGVSPGYADDGAVFAATNAGVFVSRDGGQTFESWSEGLVPPAVVALAVSPAYREDRLVYALGLGGTIWRRRDQDSSMLAGS